MRPIHRAIISFTFVFVCYMSYAFAIVPIVEPTIDKPDPHPFRDEGDSESMAAFGSFLSPEFWPDKTKCKIIQVADFHFFLQEYDLQPDGRIELSPCTIIYTPSDPDRSREENLRRSIVLESESASLNFEEGLDLFNADMGRFLGGKLLGKVVIRSDMKEPGPQDDLYIETFNLELDGSQIWAENQIVFRLGPHYGSGKTMMIQLRMDDDPVKESDMFPIVGVDFFDLAKVTEIVYTPSEDDLAGFIGETSEPVPPRSPATPGASTDASMATSTTDPPPVPWRITCDGRFHLQITKNNPGADDRFRSSADEDFKVNPVASFDDNVLIQRNNLNGTRDALGCSTLSLYFREAIKNREQAADDEDEGLFGGKSLNSMRPGSLIAMGTPAWIFVESEDFETTAPTMQFDLITQAITLARELPDPLNPQQRIAPPPPTTPLAPNYDGLVRLRRQDQSVVASSLTYVHDDSRPIGTLQAQGPGRIGGFLSSGSGETEEPQPFSAAWNGSLSLELIKNEHVLAIDQGMEVDYGTVGKLTARAMTLWFREIPPNPYVETNGDEPAIRLIPHRGLLEESVRISSENLTGEVNRLEMWFRHQISHEGYSRAPDPDPRRADATRSNPLNALSDPETTNSHFAPLEVTGDTLQVALLMTPEEAKLSQLSILGNVRLAETEPWQPGEPMLNCTGDSVYALRLNAADAQLIMRGRPASFSGRGLGLSSQNIVLDLGANRVRIDGAGRLKLKIPPDKNALPFDPPSEPLYVSWTDRLIVEGNVAQFHGNVTAQLEREDSKSSLEAPQINVYLDRPLQFDQLQPEETTPGGGSPLGGPRPIQVRDPRGEVRSAITVNEPYPYRPDSSAIMLASAQEIPPYGNPTATIPYGRRVEPDSETPQVERIECIGGVVIKNNSFKGPLQISQETINVQNLTYFVQTGAIVASGRGVVESVRYGVPSLDSVAAGREPNRDPNRRPGRLPDRSSVPEAELGYCELRFRDGLRGNLDDREVYVRGKVFCLYGPVGDWNERIDASAADRLPSNTALINCNEVAVVILNDSATNSARLDIVASGNVVMEGVYDAVEYTAQAERVSYDESKSLITLVGSEYDNATLYRQERVGSPQVGVSGERLLFNPVTNDLRIEGIEASSFGVP